MEKITSGTRIYYTGDMANNDGHGTITKIETSKWSTGEAFITMDDGREFTTYVRGIGITYKGHCGTRFVTVAAVNAYWSAKNNAYKNEPEHTNETS